MFSAAVQFDIHQLFIPNDSCNRHIGSKSRFDKLKPDLHWFPLLIACWSEILELCFSAALFTHSALRLLKTANLLCSHQGFSFVCNNWEMDKAYLFWILHRNVIWYIAPNKIRQSHTKAFCFKFYLYVFKRQCFCSITVMTITHFY